jgi:hypothetical protein
MPAISVRRMRITVLVIRLWVARMRITVAQVRFAPEFMLRNQGGDFDTADRLFYSIARQCYRVQHSTPCCNAVHQCRNTVRCCTIAAACCVLKAVPYAVGHVSSQLHDVSADLSTCCVPLRTINSVHCSAAITCVARVVHSLQWLGRPAVQASVGCA